MGTNEIVDVAVNPVFASVTNTASVYYAGGEDEFEMKKIDNTHFQLCWKSGSSNKNKLYSGVTIIVNDDQGHFADFSFAIQRFALNPSVTFNAKTSANNTVTSLYPNTAVDSSQTWWLMTNSGTSTPYVVGTLSKSGGDSTQLVNVNGLPNDVTSTNAANTGLDITYDRNAVDNTSLSSVYYLENGISWTISNMPASVQSFSSIAYAVGQTAATSFFSTSWMKSSTTAFYLDGDRYEISSATSPSSVSLALTPSNGGSGSLTWNVSTQPSYKNSKTLKLSSASPTTSSTIALDSTITSLKDLSPGSQFSELETFSGGNVIVTDTNTNDTVTIAISKVSLIPPMAVKSSISVSDTSTTVKTFFFKKKTDDIIS